MSPRRALVTGSSRGIGAAIARCLAREGMDIVLHGRAPSEPLSAVAEDVRALGRKVEVLCFDVTDARAVESAIGPLAESGGVDVLVNNAGVVSDAPFPVMPVEAWTSVLETTLGGFYRVTRPLVMPMVGRRWGRIINVSSISGVIGNRGQVNYAAAKAGLVGATKALALELAKRNVTVNAVAPGLIDTDMVKNAPVAEILPHIPMRRLGRAEEVAELVAFLASDRAAYVTGQTIAISGGLG
jgi:3-oxoacyl-[acyl-carrier protein] reductase